MLRVLTGSLLAAVVMFLIGFLAYGTPLMRLGYAQATDAVQLDVQNATASLLSTSSTLLWGFGIGGLVVGVLLALFIGRGIAKPIVAIISPFTAPKPAPRPRSKPPTSDARLR